MTVDELREILKDETIKGSLPVVVVYQGGGDNRFFAVNTPAVSIIERDTKSLAPATGRISETRPELLRGSRERVFALFDH